MIWSWLIIAVLVGLFFIKGEPNIHLIRTLRYEAVFRDSNGGYVGRKMFSKKDKLAGHTLFEGKVYFFMPHVTSYTDRMGLLGRIRSYDYFIDSSLPITFKPEEREDIKSRLNTLVGSALDADHVKKVSAEARRKDLFGLLDPKKLFIIAIVLVGAYFLFGGKS